MTKKTIMLCATLFVFFAATAFALCKSSNDKSMKQSDVQRTEKFCSSTAAPIATATQPLLPRNCLRARNMKPSPSRTIALISMVRHLTATSLTRFTKNERSRCRGDGFACLLAQYLCLYAHAFGAFLWSDRAWLV